MDRCRIARRRSHRRPDCRRARSSPQQGRVLINIGRAGILPDGDTMDLARADVGAARDAIAKNRDFIVGVKARLSRDVAGANDYEVLRRAQEVATSFDLPVMIHMGQTMSPLPRLFDLLKRGDIVTHMFAPPPNSIVDDSGRILPEVLAARRRGVWFDIGNGQNRTHAVGHHRRDHEGRLLARYVLHRLEHEQPHDRRDRLSQLHVEAARLRHDGQRGDRARDRQCRAHLPGVQRPRHAQRGRAGRRRAARAARRHFRVPRQLQEHDHRTSAAVSGGTVLAGKRIPLSAK